MNENILVKFPTRERPQKCLERIREYQHLAAAPEKVEFIVSYDLNDDTMNNEAMRSELQALGCFIVGGYSQNKIHACNRDMEYAPPFDILVLASDDMVCQMQGWDNVLRQEMNIHYPDTNGCLWHWDGDPNTRRDEHRMGLCTMNIMGRQYFETAMQGHVYHPDYKSLWCDNHYTEMGLLLGKITYFDTVLFKHVHFSNTPGMHMDDLMKRTQGFYRIDEATFRKHKANNFGIK